MSLPLAWRPLLGGALGAQAAALVKEVARALTPERAFPRAALSYPASANLNRGRAGIALLYAYLAELGWNDGVGQLSYEEAAFACVEYAMDIASDHPMTESLYAGFVGIAWVAEYLVSADSAGAEGTEEGEDGNADIDQAILGLVSRSPWRRKYELMDGLVGLGVYALERLPGTGARALLLAILDRLEEVACTEGGETSWLTRAELLPGPLRERAPHGLYNLGMAHGVPAVVALLANYLFCGIAEARVRPLLERTIAWLLRQRIPLGVGRAFPCIALPDRGTASARAADRERARPMATEPARLAWCYGEPAIAVALWLAGVAADNAAWRDIARSLALDSLARSPEQAGVTDTMFCHGSAGLAHIYNRLYHLTGEVALRDAAVSWFEWTLSARSTEPDAAFAGFFASGLADDGAPTKLSSPGFLEGAAGTALALAAACGHREPRWDRVLLLSPAAQARAPR
ncbi:lanthionine synthetase C family protein [Haliangium ochraceum]|nr:lanthionine synthetase C family protein [Haliangium ochraceum]